MRARIRGIPDLPEPTFRTWDDAWVSLDSVVALVCARLDHAVSPGVVKCTIQLARHMIKERDRVDVGPLASELCRQLRPEHIVVTPPVVQAVLMAYATEYAALGVAQVQEGWDR